MPRRVVVHHARDRERLLERSRLRLGGLDIHHLNHRLRERHDIAAARRVEPGVAFIHRSQFHAADGATTAFGDLIHGCIAL